MRTEAFCACECRTYNPDHRGADSHTTRSTLIRRVLDLLWFALRLFIMQWNDKGVVGCRLQMSSKWEKMYVTMSCWYLANNVTLKSKTLNGK